LLNAFDDALLIVDNKKVIRVANIAANKVCRGRTLRGKSIVQAFLNEPVSEAIKKAIESAEPVRERLILPSSSFGENSEYEESAWILDVAPLQVANDDSLTRIILRDITSEHKTDQIKREFVANASHELRTPLAIINGYLENLIEDDMIESPTTARKFLATMHKHGMRLSELVEDMLSISKMESGDAGMLDMTEFKIKAVIDDVIERLLPMTTKHKSKLSLILPDPELTIYCDRFYLEQILFNLTENALKQNSFHKVKVELEAVKDEDNIKITVTDNGKGIPSQHLPYIFNRFYRVQKHHSQNEVKGTGLGLSIVKHAVEGHGGKISANSTPGVQTQFEIYFPLKKNV